MSWRQTMQIDDAGDAQYTWAPDYMFEDGDPLFDAQLQEQSDIWRERIGASKEIDLWTGCNFGCRYCLPLLREWSRTYQKRADVPAGSLPAGSRLLDYNVRPRTGDLLNMKCLNALRGRRKPRGAAMLCAVCDPYPPEESRAGVTREAIRTLHREGIGVLIFTKSGMRAERDFRPARGPAGLKLGSHPEDAFGATLTFIDEADSLRWEPRAALPEERLAGLEEAHARRIPTFVNLAPVMDREQALELIRRSHAFVDFYHIGRVRQFKDPLTRAGYEDFVGEAVKLCRQFKTPCSASRPANSVDEVYRLMEDYISVQGWRILCRLRPEW